MNKKIIIGIVAVIIVAILAVLFLVGSSDVTMIAGDDAVTLSGDYLVDEKGIAYKGDIGIMFLSVQPANTTAQKELFDALKSKGKDSGYKNVSVDNIGKYKAYQYSGNPDKLKTVSTDRVASGDYEYWKDYEPYIPYTGLTDMKVSNYRYVAYTTDNSISELVIFTNSSDADLYSAEINDIVNSIHPKE